MSKTDVHVSHESHQWQTTNIHFSNSNGQINSTLNQQEIQIVGDVLKKLNLHKDVDPSVRHFFGDFKIFKKPLGIHNGFLFKKILLKI